MKKKRNLDKGQKARVCEQSLKPTGILPQATHHMPIATSIPHVLRRAQL